MVTDRMTESLGRLCILQFQIPKLFEGEDQVRDPGRFAKGQDVVEGLDLS